VYDYAFDVTMVFDHWIGWSSGGLYLLNCWIHY